MKKKNLFKLSAISLMSIVLVLSFSGCEKFLETDLSTGQIAGDEVYTSNNSVGAVMNGVYLKSTDMITGGTVGYQSSLYTDDLMLIDPNGGGKIYFINQIQGSDIALWQQAYAQIYICNSVIDGIQASKGNDLTNRNQYLGEAYFMRGWLYSFLINVYGDVPLALTTDYKANNVISRSPVAQIYNQIFSDLKKAEELLPTDYRDVIGTATAVRARPCRPAAQAMLARMYLYQGDWINAESESGKVISNPNFQLPSPAQTFLSGSKEVIWGLPPSPQSSGYVTDYFVYNNGAPLTIPTGRTFASYNLNAAISNDLLNVVEANDQRLVNWTRKISDPANNRSFTFPNKYKSPVNGVEVAVALRLAEQYLIRSEARARQNNISGSQDDLNKVRTRAGLGQTSAGNQADLVTAILKERRAEYFTEIGMRFIDLKRLKLIDQVMNAIAPSKGAVWTTEKQLWPIPASEIIVNPNLKQNPGYLN